MNIIELIYLTVGLGIIVYGVITGTLTVLSLGAGIFFIGLVPVTRADKEDLETPTGFARKLLLAWINKGQPPPK